MGSAIVGARLLETGRAVLEDALERMNAVHLVSRSAGVVFLGLTTGDRSG